MCADSTNESLTPDESVRLETEIRDRGQAPIADGDGTMHGEASFQEVAGLTTQDEVVDIASTSYIDTAEAAQPSDDLAMLGDFNYFSAPSTSTGAQASFTAALPSDFFEMTSADLRAAQASLSARAAAYREAPLLTDAMRKRVDDEKKEKWKTVVLRIRFSDRSVLEKSFLSSDRIITVYSFVRSSLREDIRVKHKFVLFTAPPRKDIRVSDPTVKNKSLYDLGLAPQSVLHFRFLDDDVDTELSKGTPPLLPAIFVRARVLFPSSQVTSESSPENKNANESPPNIEGSRTQEKKLSKILRFGKRK